ncbi:hypothetical protein ACFQ2B_05255 [Streptomyces stramineus]
MVAPPGRGHHGPCSGGEAVEGGRAEAVRPYEGAGAAGGEVVPAAVARTKAP